MPDRPPLEVTDTTLANPDSASPLLMGRVRKLSLVAGLYSTQNLCLAAFTYTFFIAAQNSGVSLQAIGAASGIALLLVLKFLWAPLIDRFGWPRIGHYRGWLILCQTMLVIGALCLAALDPRADFGRILVVFAVLFIFAGTQDVAADATTTRLLGADDRGIGNGIQAAGSSFAQVMGGGVLLVISGSFGWPVAMIVLAAFSALPMVLVLSWPERATTGHLPRPRISPRGILRLFTRPGVALWSCALMPAYLFGGTIAYNLVRPMLTAAGWSEQRLGLIVVIGGGLAGISGGIAGGLALARIGRRRGLLILGVAQLVGATATIWLSLQPSSLPAAVLVTVLSNAGFAAGAAVIFTVAMDLTRIESSGTDFTAFSTISGIVMVIAGGSGVALAGTVGFLMVSAIATFLAAVGLVVTMRFVQPVLDQAEITRRSSIGDSSP